MGAQAAVRRQHAVHHERASQEASHSSSRCLSPFSYYEAFSRTLGWITPWEQDLLRTKRVAIAGLGGVGGAHLLTLTRLGIERFRIADPDIFELANFNRQAGARCSSLNRSKVSVMTEMAKDINPLASVIGFKGEINSSNLDAFLDGIDLFVDGLDFFSPAARAAAFAACRRAKIPAITAAPIGMGVSFLYFAPDGMSFEDYFGLEGRSTNDQLVRFLTGLCPRSLSASYLVDRSRVDLSAHRGPSTPMAIDLCAGVVGTEALKLLLRRGPIRPAPWCHQFDTYLQQWRRTYVLGGHRNPIMAARRRVATIPRPSHQEGSQRPAQHSVQHGGRLIEKILNTARWAPSGDNGQPWRFETLSDTRVRVHLKGDSDDIYDAAGRPTLLSGGALLENVRLSASTHGCASHWEVRASSDEGCSIDVTVESRNDVKPEPLAHFIEHRSVDRRAYTLKPISERTLSALTAAVRPTLDLRWFGSAYERSRLCRLNAQATHLRMNLPEAARAHARVVDLRAGDSETGIPLESLGVDPLMRAVLRRVLPRPQRALSFARHCGTALPRMESDWLPGLACAAHFMLALPTNTRRSTAIDLLKAGMHIQRLWLTATAHGLALQPGYAPLAFAYYAETGEAFTECRTTREQAMSLAGKLRALWPGHDGRSIVFSGRLGVPLPHPPTARSVRRPLSELLLAKIEECS